MGLLVCWPEGLKQKKLSFVKLLKKEDKIVKMKDGKLVKKPFDVGEERRRK